MPYDSGDYPTRVWCRVALHPADRSPTRTVDGDYLDLWDADESPSLDCGIEAIITDLGLPFLDSDEHYLAVCEAVDRQLARRPWAELACPIGRIRLDLVSQP